LFLIIPETGSRHPAFKLLYAFKLLFEVKDTPGVFRACYLVAPPALLPFPALQLRVFVRIKSEIIEL
ncbi:MAG: hypothetical protein U9N45_05065, partial [Gemmatimonadota bacterium]|nr:hypothetical protein [Gemmatimonadota bacterium]